MQIKLKKEIKNEVAEITAGNFVFYFWKAVKLIKDRNKFKGYEKY